MSLGISFSVRERVRERVLSVSCFPPAPEIQSAAGRAWHCPEEQSCFFSEPAEIIETSIAFARVSNASCSREARRWRLELRIGASGCRLPPCNMWGSAPGLRRLRSRALATETDQMAVSTGACGSRAKIGIRPTSARGVRSTIRWSQWAPMQAAKAGASGCRNPPGSTWTTAGGAVQTRHQ